MSHPALHRRSLRYHWRVHLATALCVAVATTALTGSLLVGNSMRASLRDEALRRVGRVEYALIAPRFFREELVAQIANTELGVEFAGVCPLIVARGTVQNAGSGASAGRVNVFGVDQRFWDTDQARRGDAKATIEENAILLNESLAHDLGIRPGEDVLVRLPAWNAVPAESLLGRTDRATTSLRLTVGRILPADDPGGLDLNPTQEEPRNAFISLTALQRALKQPGRVNAIFEMGSGAADMAGYGNHLQDSLKANVRLPDYRLRLRPDPAAGSVVLESDTLFIPPPAETAATQVAAAIGSPMTPVLTYLANSMALIPTTQPATQSGLAPIRKEDETPYSTISAIAMPEADTLRDLTLTNGHPAPLLRDKEIHLNQWAADDLKAAPGDRVLMTYYVTDAFHRLQTESATFTIRGIIRMEGLAIDRTLAPEYEGITSAKRLSDWNPPFPMDMRRIRPRDEAYWDKYGPSPKAFVSLETGQRLWTQSQSRFGRLTSIRFGAAPGESLETTAGRFERELLRRLSPESVGLVFQPVRAKALAASQGSTDFGTLFIAFSVFLIASAAMLTALVFRLGAERRATEIGLLLAVGFSRKVVNRHLLGEAVWPAGIGAAIGLLGSAGYAALMLTGLRTWWSWAVNATFLRLHVGAASLLIGWAAGLAIAMLSIAWSVRGLSRSSPRALLAGSPGQPRARSTKRRNVIPVVIGVVSLAIALLLILMPAGGEALSRTLAFFGSGTALLIASIAALAFWARITHRKPIHTAGRAGILHLGIRNAARNRIRTLLTAGLIASATFIITTVGASRAESGPPSGDRKSGTGGFSLLAESTVPIVQDLNSPDGRRALGLSRECQQALSDSFVMPFRLRPGDEASCLNLYRPTQPRLLGATRAMIDRGGFTFKTSLAQSPAQKSNPWLLLDKTWPDGAIPTIGDDSTVTWLLHLGLGDDLVVTDELSRPVHLRIVGLLLGSILQSELVIPESRFVEHFPSIGGYGFFLIETPDLARTGWPTLSEGVRETKAEARTRPSREPEHTIRPERAPRPSNREPTPEGVGQPATRDASARALPAVWNCLAYDLANYGLEVTPTAERLEKYLAVENAYLSAFGALGGLGTVLGTLGLGAVLWRNATERRGELALLRAFGYRRADLRWMVLSEHVAILIYGLMAGTLSALLAITPQAASDLHQIPWTSIGLTLLAVLAAGIAASVAAIIPATRTPLLAALRTE